MFSKQNYTLFWFFLIFLKSQKSFVNFQKYDIPHQYRQKEQTAGPSTEVGWTLELIWNGKTLLLWCPIMFRNGLGLFWKFGFSDHFDPFWPKWAVLRINMITTNGLGLFVFFTKTLPKCLGVTWDQPELLGKLFETFWKSDPLTLSQYRGIWTKSVAVTQIPNYRPLDSQNWVTDRDHPELLFNQILWADSLDTNFKTVRTDGSKVRKRSLGVMGVMAGVIWGSWVKIFLSIFSPFQGIWSLKNW